MRQILGERDPNSEHVKAAKKDPLWIPGVQSFPLQRKVVLEEREREKSYCISGLGPDGRRVGPASF